MNVILYQRYGAAGKNLYKQDCHAEQKSVGHRRADPHGGAHAQCQTENGVFVEQPVGDQLHVGFGGCRHDKIPSIIDY